MWHTFGTIRGTLHMYGMHPLPAEEHWLRWSGRPRNGNQRPNLTRGSLGRTWPAPNSGLCGAVPLVAWLWLTAGDGREGLARIWEGSGLKHDIA